MLGINAFGEFTMIQSTVGLFGTFAGLGLGITATKYVAELRELHPVRCGRVVGLILTVAAAGGLIAGAALVLFAPWVATYTLAAPKLAPLLRAGSLLVLFSTLQGVYSGALGGFEAFKRVAHVNWVGAILGTPLLVVCAYTGRLEGAVWGNVVQIALGCAIGHWALAQEAGKRGVKLCYALDLRDFSILWRFSLPAFLSSTLVGPVNWICSTFLAHQKEGFREVALMNAAGQWRNFLIFLPATMTGVLVPMFSSLYHAGNRAEFEKLLRRNMVINVGTALVLSVPISLLATVILDWYGPGFRRGVPVFLLAVFGTAVTAAANLFSRAMQATGRAWMEMAFNALWATALILGCFLLVPTYKAVGLATSHVLAAFALVIWQWLLVRRLLSKASAASIELRGSEPARSG